MVECGKEEVEFVPLGRSPPPPPANAGRERHARCEDGLLSFPGLAVAFSPVRLPHAHGRLVPPASVSVRTELKGNYSQWSIVST
ncbi:hypothetical protein GUJ93_ZPchr0012g22064 [Zizania palustris]|uniref:Uncharacterized protein n=1 Tax=Zizania palustris TaxID=103762 RepID=A0A8J5WLA7_ZIZPA|nr:hypothetical protein GUJ93_ZPchr0012g22064 [Zizania palustris]